MDLVCARCHQGKHVSEFAPSSRSWCRACSTEYARDRRQARAKKRECLPPGSKRCPMCRQVLDRGEFRPRASGNGVHAYCRPCELARNEVARRKTITNPRGPLGTEWAPWRSTGLHRCSACHETKPVEDFPWHKAGGRPRPICRTCQRKRNKAFMRTPAGKRSALRYSRKRDKRKTAARDFTRAAIVLGYLVRQPCEVCGTSKVQAHHGDYEKPLDVRWLCTTHHADEHGARR